MPGGHHARQFSDRIDRREILRHVADAAPRIELHAVKTGDAHRFLSAVLQRVQAKRGHRGGVAGAKHAENAAFLVQLVAVRIEKGIGQVHVGL